MHSRENFGSDFKLLTGHGPFPWQQKLFEEFLEQRFPEACDIPTGLGKTSVIAIWVLALAQHAGAGTTAAFPRRLVYVVNRRTVVDQATREAEQLRQALVTKPELRGVADVLRSLGIGLSGDPLAISTLRGQFADNTDWRNDPARPAVIVGTVDMVGSRLLFAGYGCGFKSKPLHAGFLGQDAVLMHDEAHLEPAFQNLIAAIAAEQRRRSEFGRFGVMALTATSRSGAKAFHLTDADRNHEEVRKRIDARKLILFHHVDDETGTADRVTSLALKHKNSGQAILVFLRKLDDVEEVAAKLSKEQLPVQKLTGTLRGLERDALVKEDPIFARFMPKPEVAPEPGTVFLVCTSAGEVGVNISADHLVCDLTPFDSMAQRFGRVNRFGDGDARIDLVYPTLSDEKDRLLEVRQRTLELLRRLPQAQDGHGASPASLNSLPIADRQAAFTPPPLILPATDILFDAWALTSIRGKLPGRPQVAAWLHGVAEWEPPETVVAWREEVELITPDLQEKYRPEDLLDDYPLKPHELLRDKTLRIFGHLERIARKHSELSAWVLESDGEVTVFSLAELVEKDRRNKPKVNIAECTVLLPPVAGGLMKGTLDGDVEFEPDQRTLYDVADKWTDENRPRRCRVWDDGQSAAGMRLVRTIDTRPPDADDELDEGEQPDSHRYWRWYVRPRSADDDGSRTASRAQELDAHCQSAERFASALVAKLGLGKREASAA